MNRTKIKAAKANKQAANNADDLRYVTFGVARIDGEDHIIRLGDYTSPRHLIRDSAAYVAKQHAEFRALWEPTAQQLRAANKSGKHDNNTPYSNFIDLSENGRALSNVGWDNAKTDFEQWYEQVTTEFNERLEADYYDREFPEHAVEMSKFVQKAITSKNALHNAVKIVITAKTKIPIQLPEHAVINPEYLTSVIQDYLEEAKREIIKTGTAEGMIGWDTEDGLLVYPSGPMWQKYRFGRAVSEVAAIINAPFVIQAGEAWLRDPKTDERTGELLIVNIVSPDGKVVAQGEMLFHRNPLKFEEMKIMTDIKQLEEAKQFLFPKWAYFSTSDGKAA